MPILRRLSHWGLMRRGAERRLAGEYARRLAIKAPSTAQLMGRLSGGNQQKVILSRWLATDPKVLILDEPTQGIDIGAKAEVHQLINELAGAGMAILLISSEMLEVLGMSDRIVVMREGRVAGELTGAEATEERVLSLAAGVAEAGTWS
jgi:ABC-type sugar transport system ATPase subunit